MRRANARKRAQALENQVKDLFHSQLILVGNTRGQRREDTIALAGLRQFLMRKCFGKRSRV